MITDNNSNSLEGSVVGSSINSDYYVVSGSAIAGSTGTIVWGPTGAVSQAGIRLGGGVDLAKRVGPRLFFRFIKSKLTKVEQKRLKARLDKLKQLVVAARDTDQQALYEALAEKLVVLVREAGAVAVEVDTYVEKSVIEKFMTRVCDEDGEGHVFLKPLEEFPRLLPQAVQKKVKALKAKKIFDDFVVLYLNYDPEVVKTNKEKIREKDPILFGTFKGSPEKLYYITDWTDEYCDLTLDKFIEKVKDQDIPEPVQKVAELGDDFVANLVKEVEGRRQRLASARMSNYRDLMVEEEREKIRQQAKREVEEALAGTRTAGCIRRFFRTLRDFVYRYGW
jgi:hypothetical protein